MAGVSASKLSRLAGLNRVHVGLIEGNEQSRIEAGTAEKLAKVLGCSLDWLISGNGKPPSDRAVHAAVLAAEVAAGLAAATVEAPPAPDAAPTQDALPEDDAGKSGENATADAANDGEKPTGT